MMTLESELRRQLHELLVEYKTKAQPIIDELVKIECAKPRPPMIIQKGSFVLERDGSLKPTTR